VSIIYELFIYVVLEHDEGKDSGRDPACKGYYGEPDYVLG
jgi:hypothetical protein